jgi:hypothetical protein
MLALKPLAGTLLIVAKVAGRLFWRIAGLADYTLTVARLWLLDRVAGPDPETPTDRAIREEGERLRRAFPQIDFDDPSPRIVPPQEHLRGGGR